MVAEGVAPLTPHDEGFIYRTSDSGHALFTIHLYRRHFNPKLIIMDVEVQTQNLPGVKHPVPRSIWLPHRDTRNNAFLYVFS